MRRRRTNDLRRRWYGDDIVAIVKTLGGDAPVAALYDVRRGLLSSSGNFVSWSDARGGGFGPTISTITGTAPLVTAGGIQTSGAGSAATAASALFDVSAGYTLALIGAVNNNVGGYFASLADAVARTRQLAIKNVGGVSGDIAGAWYSGGAEQTQVSGVDSGVTRRIVIVKCGGTTGTVFVPNAGGVRTRAITAVGAGSNQLTLFDYFPGGAAYAQNTGLLRAVIAIRKVTSNAEDLAIRDWAVKYHTAVPI